MIIDNNSHEPIHELPSLAGLSRQELASKAAAVILCEITNGRSNGPGISLSDPRETLHQGIEWFLGGQEPRSFGAQQLPGDAGDDIRDKMAVMDELRARIGEGMIRLDG